MTNVGRKHGRGADDLIADVREELGPERTAKREAEIAALPTVEWKGRTLYTLRCNGTSGKGPHDVNVPLAMVWHLIKLRRYFCPYHAGDVWGPAWEPSPAPAAVDPVLPLTTTGCPRAGDLR